MISRTWWFKLILLSYLFLHPCKFHSSRSFRSMTIDFLKQLIIYKFQFHRDFTINLSYLLRQMDWRLDDFHNGCFLSWGRHTHLSQSSYVNLIWSTVIMKIWHNNQDFNLSRWFFLPSATLPKVNRKDKKQMKMKVNSLSLSEPKSTDGLGCTEPAKFRVELKKSGS